jgi:hypothetical protein
MRAAQVVKELVLVSLGQLVGRGTFFDASIPQLREQYICWHLELGGKLGYVVTRHSVLFSI